MGGKRSQLLFEVRRYFIFYALRLPLFKAKEIPLYVFFKTRLYKNSSAGLFWSYIWLALTLLHTQQSVNPFLFALKPFFENTSIHLWFVYSLLGIYLILPILHKITTHSTSKELHYFCFLWLTFKSVLPYLEIFLALSR